jgi:hypothetical protein
MKTLTLSPARCAAQGGAALLDGGARRPDGRQAGAGDLKKRSAERLATHRATRAR